MNMEYRKGDVWWWDNRLGPHGLCGLFRITDISTDYAYGTITQDADGNYHHTTIRITDWQTGKPMQPKNLKHLIWRGTGSHVMLRCEEGGENET